MERSTPILCLCHGIFTERFILDYLFAGNRLLALAWVIRSMKREEKNGGPMRGCLHIETTQIPPFFCYPSLILPFLIYLTILCKFFTLAKKFAGVRIIAFFLVVFIHTVRKDPLRKF